MTRLRSTRLVTEHATGFKLISWKWAQGNMWAALSRLHVETCDQTSSISVSSTVDVVIQLNPVRHTLFSYVEDRVLTVSVCIRKYKYMKSKQRILAWVKQNVVSRTYETCINPWQSTLASWVKSKIAQTSLDESIQPSQTKRSSHTARSLELVRDMKPWEMWVKVWPDKMLPSRSWRKTVISSNVLTSSFTY